MDEPHAAGNEQDNAGKPDLKEGCDDTVAGGTSDKHSAELVHHTTDDAGCGTTDSKPSMHDCSDLSTAESIPDNHNADDDQTATADASWGDGEVKPNNSGDNGASNADSTEATVQAGENESAAWPITREPYTQRIISTCYNPATQAPLPIANKPHAALPRRSF